MGTSSTISIQNDNGSVTGIYCHWDGYLENNGRILVESFNTEEKIRELLALGNLSCLTSEIGEKHDFNKSNPAWCVAYGRDRGDKDQGAKTVGTIGLYLQRHGQEYNYYFSKGKWEVVVDGKVKDLAKLIAAI